MGDFFDSLIGIFFFALFMLLPLGELYWLWTAIQLGSFSMFVLGLIPPFQLLAMPVGAYMFVFGIPDWVINWFA